MTDRLRLVIFDVDGTLVDSQGDIVAAMTAAFAAVDRPVPSRAVVLGIVGLSLDTAMATLLPEAETATHRRMAEAYRDAYAALRSETGVAQSSPLYPGTREVIEAIHARPHILLGIATGKSRRGLDKLLDGHGLRPYFVTAQVADDHPSKPSPSMLHAALSETGCAAADAVMVGDTTFDMQMARAAGIPGIGVGWGYHDMGRLAPEADRMIDRIDALPPLLDDLWRS